MIKNLGTEQTCKKCGFLYIKNATTGNQCDPCRRGRSKGRKRTRSKRIKTHIVVVSGGSGSKLRSELNMVYGFVEKIERQGGFLYTLEDLNMLLTCWQTITPVNSGVYDKKPAGHQLYYMYNDLKNWCSL